MTNIVKHRFTSAKSDGSDVTQIQPSNWNDGHAFIGGAAGDVLTCDPSDPNFGAKWAPSGIWSPYTPVLQTTDNNLVPGNSLFRGGYAIVGRTAHITIRIRIGSTFNRGTGYWYVKIPIVANSSLAVNASMPCFVIRGGFVPPLIVNGHTLPAPFLIGPPANYEHIIMAIVVGNTGGFVYGDWPWPWADGDVLQIAGTLPME